VHILLLFLLSPFPPFPFLSVYLPLGSTTYLSQPPYTRTFISALSGELEMKQYASREPVSIPLPGSKLTCTVNANLSNTRAGHSS
jgi:hypothetical protein